MVLYTSNPLKSHKYNSILVIPYSYGWNSFDIDMNNPDQYIRAFANQLWKTNSPRATINNGNCSKPNIPRPNVNNPKIAELMNMVNSGKEFKIPNNIPEREKTPSWAWDKDLLK